MTNIKNQMIEWRHHLHTIPESAFNEVKTSAYIAQELEKMGLEVHRGIGKTGVVGVLKKGDSDKAIAFRSDIDCIERSEDNNNDIDYKSTHENRMHACGHDGHMATLLGTAKLLSESDNINGTVVFIFQPAEEPGYGAKAMIEDGLFEKFPVDAIYGFHNAPNLPEGEIHTRKGGIMAAEDNFKVNIHGIGGHASSPHMGKDPMVVAAEIILALQTIVSRNTDPSSTAVVSITELYMDGLHNAIASNVELHGDCRSYDPEVSKLIERRAEKIVKGICEANEVDYKFVYSREFLSTINTEAEYDIARAAAKKVVGENKVNDDCIPWTGAEDFSQYLQKVPGCLVFIGSRKEGEQITPLHHGDFNYNDEILETGANYFVEVAEPYLK